MKNSLSLRELRQGFEERVLFEVEEGGGGGEGEATAGAAEGF